VPGLEPSPNLARRAVVLGGTGHLGNAVVRELLARGWTVTVACRRPEGAPNLEDLPVRLAPGDGEVPGQLETWVRGHDVVVDAAAPYPVSAFREPASRLVRRAVRRTRTLVDAVATQGARLAVISSFTTLPRSTAAVGTEAMCRLHPYFRVKEAIETEVLETARSGLPAVVVNPTVCLGPWDLKPVERALVPSLLRGEVPAAFHHTVNVVDVREVGTALVAALDRGPFGEPIPVSGHNLPIASLHRWICELAGVEPPRWRLPARLSLGPALAAEAGLALLGRPPLFPALVAMLVLRQEWRAPSTVQIALGAAPRALSATLADSLRWYRGLGVC
jgi:dihydroflavonol-4-reductase